MTFNIIMINKECRVVFKNCMILNEKDFICKCTTMLNYHIDRYEDLYLCFEGNNKKTVSFHWKSHYSFSKYFSLPSKHLLKHILHSSWGTSKTVTCFMKPSTPCAEESRCPRNLFLMYGNKKSHVIGCQIKTVWGKKY